MKSFFKELFEYHHHFNQELINLFIENKNKLSERTIPLFSHCLNAHQIWNSRILNIEAYGVHQIHMLEKCKSIDVINYNDTLKIIDAFDLNKTFAYKNSKEEYFENSIKDTLFHVVNHFTHHKGQLISDLRQQGIEPPITDYIFYKR